MSRFKNLDRQKDNFEATERFFAILDHIRGDCMSCAAKLADALNQIEAHMEVSQ